MILSLCSSCPLQHLSYIVLRIAILAGDELGSQSKLICISVMIKDVRDFSKKIFFAIYIFPFEKCLFIPLSQLLIVLFSFRLVFSNSLAIICINIPADV